MHFLHPRSTLCFLSQLPLPPPAKQRAREEERERYGDAFSSYRVLNSHKYHPTNLRHIIRQNRIPSRPAPAIIISRLSYLVSTRTPATPPRVVSSWDLSRYVSLQSWDYAVQAETTPNYPQFMTFFLALDASPPSLLHTSLSSPKHTTRVATQHYQTFPLNSNFEADATQRRINKLLVLCKSHYLCKPRRSCIYILRHREKKSACTLRFKNTGI